MLYHTKLHCIKYYIFKDDRRRMFYTPFTVAATSPNNVIKASKEENIFVVYNVKQFTVWGMLVPVQMSFILSSCAYNVTIVYMQNVWRLARKTAAIRCGQHNSRTNIKEKKQQSFAKLVMMSIDVFRFWCQFVTLLLIGFDTS